MKQNRFLLLCLAVVLAVLGGGVYKHTALKELRPEPNYLNDVKYTVEVYDVDAKTADMFFRNMGIWLENGVSAGTGEKIQRTSAASGAAERYDVTLLVSAVTSSATANGYGSYDVTSGNLCHFTNRMMDFDGYITHIEED